MTWRRWFRAGRGDVRADVDDELQFHLDQATRDLIASGVLPAEARAEAERRFGALDPIRSDLMAMDTLRERRDHRREWLSDLLQDLRFGWRTLRRSPAFTLTAVLCIGLGVGVTTTIFGAVHAILIRSLPYERPDDLAALYSRNTSRGIRGANISYPDYMTWRDQNRTFAQLGIWTWSTLTLSGDGEAERLEGAAVTANLFPLLGVVPILGRTFAPEEEQDGRDRVLLLSYGLWRRRYGGDPGIVGRSVTVDGLPYVVIGVMPPRLSFPDRGQAWTPFVPAPGEVHGNRGYAGALGRLKPGVVLQQAQADLDGISARLQQEFPRDNFGWDVEALPLRDDLVGELRRPLRVFAGSVALVLLIVCANVASLLLTRGAGRQREVAIRTAMGARRGRLIRQLLTESLILAMAGGALGVWVATYGVRLLRLTFPNEVPFYIDLGIDRTALLFTMALSGLTGLLCGIVPALRATDLQPAAALKEGGERAGAGRSRLRRGLVIAEVALSLVLMVGAGLLIKSYRRLMGTELGFEERGILSLRLSLPDARYVIRARRAEFYRQLLDRIGSLPGVEAVGSAQGIPFSGWNMQSVMSIEGRPPRPQGEELVVHYQWVTPDYFTAIGVPVQRGRGLSAADRDSLAPVGVINETLARMEFAGEDPIGKRIRFGGLDSQDSWVTIVGVVRDFRHYQLPQRMGPAIYYSYYSYPLLTQTVAIRTSLRDPLALVPAVREVVGALDPEVPAYAVQTFEQAVSRSLWRQRLLGQVLGLFAVMALALASIGVYGVMSYAVNQRTREFGVRTALGATGGRLVGMVARQGVALTAIGVGIGLAGALALTRLLSDLLYEVRPTDAATFIGVPLELATVAGLASWLPARRAARVDPLVAMRAE